MMARTKRVRRGYSAGEWGRNRVRVFPDPKTGLYQIEWRENGRRLSRSLKHRDWKRAKRQADEAAAGFAAHQPNGRKDAEPEPLTLERLFEIYGEEVTPTKGEHTRQHDRTTMEMFLRFLGRDRDPATLSQRDWDRFIRARREGRVGPSGRPVSDRTVEYDLKLLIAIFNWAAKSRDERGRLLLDRNPLRGLRTPREKNPTRVVLAEDEYQALLTVSRKVDWRFHVALVLAHETGHRIGAIRKLRWADIDLDAGVVWWRAEHEKTGYEHTTPVTAEALAALAEARGRKVRGGDAPVLPAPGNPSVSVGSSRVRSWWAKAQKLAGLEPKRGRGWHSLRRKFATDLMDQPLKVLCDLGGWKTAKTVLRCYQQADEGQLRKALDNRRRGALRK
ncbi:MAG: site-specific integrase [Gemmatimonadota bacterium]|nr:site-specific integrase [Gemmatimonadota bacterium]